MSKIRFSALASVLALASCDAPLPTTAVTLDVGNVGNGVVITAMGAGVVDLTAGVGGPEDADFQFVATWQADGTVTGHWRQSRMRPGGLADLAGFVTCLTTDPAFPGRARIGGVITENNSTDPAFLTENHEVGDDAWFRVQDGEDAAGAVDASTTIGVKPVLVNTSAEYCALPFTGLPAWNPATIFPLRYGTIGVKQ
jgi:hypothetical protein